MHKFMQYLQSEFFRFMGLSGWLVILLIIQINRLSYLGTSESVSTLHWTEGGLIFMWILAKHEHLIFETIAEIFNFKK